MTISPTFTLETRTTLAGLDFAALAGTMRQQAQVYELEILEDSAQRILVEVRDFGRLQAEARAEGCEVRLRAALPDRLQMLQDSFVEQLRGLQPQAAETLRWQGGEAAGAVPPNVHFTTVQSVAPLGRSFLRVTVKGDDLSGFQDDAIHFRLLLPPSDCETPEWPRLGENGATIWPKGEMALHRPVYTTRKICHQSGEMAFDIFVHEGGRATEWANRARPGDRLAIAGPGGGGIPDARKILLYGDETALPAIARILDSLPADASGAAVLLADGGADCGYPLTPPAGITLRWLDRRRGDALTELALAALPEHRDHFLWFAAEKSQTQPVRTAVKDAQADPATHYIAAYWSKP